MSAESPNSSPFLEPKFPLYKNFNGREKIESVLAEFESPERLKWTAEYFFGTNYDPGLLSAEELEQFKVFSHFGLKRILNAEMQRTPGTLMHLDRVLHDPEKHHLTSAEFRLAMHDLSHLAGCVINGRYEINQNSPLPPFYEFREFHEFNNKEVMENELYGFLWGTYFRYKEFTLDKLHGDLTQEQFIEKYLTDCMEETLRENHASVLHYMERKKMPIRERGNFSWNKQEDARRIADEIIANPPDDLVRMLTYTWEHKENPRVLADLFFKELGPYIDGLQKRKTYTKLQEDSLG